MVYTVYILYSKSLDRSYTGHTRKLADRLKHHNQGRSKATRAGISW
ncbi:MAG: GIY-YIG nuclease family protein [Candidatus Marinimicrobia bacterium]|nr:GIY-YIG nuclease family protein [Candidatus Neomarinimicrobiota bacterium]MCF7829363.1 GIY-YIG nuclease family protein [Candidatus Neomarinimicrobiota bacterium]MCF7880849.1 GIY-YIG nuclease family protein [Candidatus Neomarinimicrobiota bacterium]